MDDGWMTAAKKEVSFLSSSDNVFYFCQGILMTHRDTNCVDGQAVSIYMTHKLISFITIYNIFSSFHAVSSEDDKLKIYWKAVLEGLFKSIWPEWVKMFACKL